MPEEKNVAVIDSEHDEASAIQCVELAETILEKNYGNDPELRGKHPAIISVLWLLREARKRAGAELKADPA